MSYLFNPKSKFLVVRIDIESIAVNVYECQEKVVIWKGRIEWDNRSNFYECYGYKKCSQEILMLEKIEDFSFRARNIHLMSIH